MYSILILIIGVVVSTAMANVISSTTIQTIIAPNAQISKRQLTPLQAFADCYPQCDYAVYAYQSIGPISSILCDPWGAYVLAYEAAVDCILSCSVDGGCIGSSLVTQLDVPRSICGATPATNIAVSTSSISTRVSTISSSGTTRKSTVISQTVLVLTSSASVNTTSILNSLYSAYRSSISCNGVLSSGSSTASNYISCKAAFPASQVTVTLSPNQTSPGSSSATSNLSAISASDNRGLSTGAIAGIAVGAAAGTFVMLAAIAFFVFRRRKQARERNSITSLTDDQKPAEKARLDSTEHEPRIEELEASNGVRKIRQVGGLNEMEHNPMLPRIIAEMPANETSAAEMDSSLSPTTNRSSTLLISNTRDSGSRY